jgi:hypothetical protein
MSRWIHVASLTLAMSWPSLAARAVEVSVQLHSATALACESRRSHSGGSTTCKYPAAAVEIVPGPSAGLPSSIDVDAVGEVIRGTLSLDGYTLASVPVAAWSGPLDRLDSSRLGSSDPNHAWPVSLAGQVDAGSWRVVLTRFTDQASFAGELELTFRQNTASSVPAGAWRRWTTWVVTHSFATVPNAGPPPCLGETLHFDDDADGEVNARDLAPHALDPAFGAGLDEWGRTIAEFCQQAQAWCRRADFRNDEPQSKAPRDCRLRAQQCVPMEMFGPGAAPALPTRQCLGHDVISDSDADGEPDATDRCGDTPASSLIDGSGCSAAQFCRPQSSSACRRADFRNDEPLAKGPGDCVKTREKPRACAAATSN